MPIEVLRSSFTTHSRVVRDFSRHAQHIVHIKALAYLSTITKETVKREEIYTWYTSSPSINEFRYLRPFPLSRTQWNILVSFISPINLQPNHQPPESVITRGSAPLQHSDCLLSLETGMEDPMLSCASEWPLSHQQSVSARSAKAR